MGKEKKRKAIVKRVEKQWERIQRDRYYQKAWQRKRLVLAIRGALSQWTS